MYTVADHAERRKSFFSISSGFVFDCSIELEFGGEGKGNSSLPEIAIIFTGSNSISKT
jgi:hypothetical protein